MKIDIVTPYGNNKFDLGVNEVTALIQKAYEYSERICEEVLRRHSGRVPGSGGEAETEETCTA